MLTLEVTDDEYRILCRGLVDHSFFSGRGPARPTAIEETVMLLAKLCRLGQAAGLEMEQHV